MEAEMRLVKNAQPVNDALDLCCVREVTRCQRRPDNVRDQLDAPRFCDHGQYL